MKTPHPFVLLLATVGFAACAAPPAPPPEAAAAHLDRTPVSAAPAAGQPDFATPQEAVAALYRAASAKDLATMTGIVGLAPPDVSTGDQEQDARQAEQFVAAHDEELDIVLDGETCAHVCLGKDHYPLAAPLKRVADRWKFDAAVGRQEHCARVIGENELATIGVCRAFVQAQYEYYAEDRNGDDVLQYARRLASTPGTHDGLYWCATDDEPQSPLGPLVAAARANGFLSGGVRQLDEPKPYHGYLFRVLEAQGDGAPGGAYSYVVNGRMIAGFALVASPAQWQRSGVMSFLVGANGKVYQCDLGADSAAVAAAMTVYEPRSPWTLVRE